MPVTPSVWTLMWCLFTVPYLCSTATHCLCGTGKAKLIKSGSMTSSRVCSRHTQSRGTIKLFTQKKSGKREEDDAIAIKSNVNIFPEFHFTGSIKRLTYERYNESHTSQIPRHGSAVDVMSVSLHSLITQCKLILHSLQTEHQ